MKLFNLAKYALITLCIGGLASHPAVAHKKHHDNWDKHYFGNNKHGYQINHNSYASGRVLEVVPIYKDKRNNRRHQHCWLEPDRRYHQQHYRHNKDSKHGKHQRNGRYNDRYFEVCDNGVHHGKHFKHNRGKVKGYHVTYKYKGEVYQSFTREHPGKFIDLVVSVIPRE